MQWSPEIEEHFEWYWLFQEAEVGVYYGQLPLFEEQP